MHRNYKIDDYIELNNVKYKVEKIEGIGASSVVYRTRKLNDNSLHIIKEYNPQSIILTRNERCLFDLSCLDKESIQRYYDGRERFIEAAKKQRELRSKYLDITNNTPDVNIIIEMECMVYVDVSFFDGKTYEEISTENNLKELLNRIQAILKAVKAYHDNGFLHLDLKPSNIFVLNNSLDHVLLFDFDSVKEKNKIRELNVPISCSANWAAPEQINYRYRSRISEQSDIYSIGEILFYKVFGRHSYIYERRTFSTYEYDSSDICKNVNPKVLDMISDIFRKSIVSNPDRRYKNCDEFIKKISDAIDCLNKGEVYVKPLSFERGVFFVGREKQYEELDEMLSNNRVVLVNGIGGIGKSEFIKGHINNNRKMYDNILYAVQDSSVSKIVTQSLAQNLINFELGDESEDKKIKKVTKQLNALLTEKDLVVLDNIESDFFDDKNKEIRDSLLGIRCKFIIISRYSSNLFRSITLNELSGQELKELFEFWYKEEIEDFAIIDKIITLVGNHTLTVELIAKLCFTKYKTPSEILLSLETKGLEFDDTIVVSERNLTEYKESVIGHINQLFNMSDLSYEEHYILQCVRLAPTSGIPGRLFLELIKPLSGDSIQELVREGWIKNDCGILSMHPLISTVTKINERDNISYDSLLENFLTHFSLDNNVINQDSYEIYISICNKLAKTYSSAAFLRFLAYRFETQYLSSTDEEKGIELIRNLYNSQNFKHSQEVFITLLDSAIYFGSTGKECAREFLSYAKNELPCDDYIKVFEAGNLYVEGELAFFNGDFYKAEAYLKRCIVLYQELAECYGDYAFKLASTYCDLGQVKYQMDDNCSAEKCYLKSLNLYKAIQGENGLEILKLYNLLGELYQDDDKYELAMDYISRAYMIAIDKYGSESILSSEIHRNMGFVLCEKGEIEQAIEIFETERMYLENTLSENDRELGVFYMYLMRAYGKKGLLSKAQEYMDKSNGILSASKLDNWILLGRNHLSMGTYYRTAGSIEEGNYHLLEALKYFMTENKTPCERDLRTTFAQVGYLELERDKNKALVYFDKALEIAKKEIRVDENFVELMDEEMKKLK